MENSPLHRRNKIPCFLEEYPSSINNTGIHTRRIGHSFGRTRQLTTYINMVQKSFQNFIGSRPKIKIMGESSSMLKKNIDQVKLL